MERRSFLKILATLPAASFIPIQIPTPSVIPPSPPDLQLVRPNTFAIGLFSGTEEIAYKGYERATIDRTKEAWIVEGKRGSNAVEITFPEVTSQEFIEVTNFKIFDENGIELYTGVVEGFSLLTAGTTFGFPPDCLSITEG